MRSQLLEILRCPEDHSPLTEASEALLADVNAAIRAGRLTNTGRKRLEQVVEGGLVREAGDLLYPIVDQIPLLLRDEAIPLNQLDRGRAVNH